MKITLILLLIPLFLIGCKKDDKDNVSAEAETSDNHIMIKGKKTSVSIYQARTQAGEFKRYGNGWENIRFYTFSTKDNNDSDTPAVIFTVLATYELKEGTYLLDKSFVDDTNLYSLPPKFNTVLSGFAYRGWAENDTVFQSNYNASDVYNGYVVVTKHNGLYKFVWNIDTKHGEVKGEYSNVLFTDNSLWSNDR